MPSKRRFIYLLFIIYYYYILLLLIIITYFLIICSHLVGILLGVPQIQQLGQCCHLATAASVAECHEAVVCLRSPHLVQIFT